MANKKKEMSRTEGAVTALVGLPGVADVAKKFGDASLQIELRMPDEKILALLVDPAKLVTEANEFVIDSDDSYKLAKAASDSLKDEGDIVEEARTAGTKPINSLTAGWNALLMPGRKCRETAAGIYQRKMRAYEAKLEEEDEKAREKQAQEAEAQRTELLRQAEEKKKRAGRLKHAGKKEEALREAESLEEAARMIPTDFAQTETSVPDLGSGGKQKRWVGSVDAEDDDFIHWLWKNPLWRKKILQYVQGGLNDLAKQIKKNTKIPGFTARQESSYRRESKRK